MTYYSNIPTILTQQDFNNRHADMLASARGEVFIGWDFGSEDRTIVWFSDINPVEENVFYRMWRENKVTAKPEWSVNIPDIKFYEEGGEISKDAYDGISMRKITEYRPFSHE